LSKSDGENYCIITVPALRFLYSQWDQDLGHFIRFDKKLFAGLVDGTGWAIESMHTFFRSPYCTLSSFAT